MQPTSSRSVDWESQGSQLEDSPCLLRGARLVSLSQRIPDKALEQARLSRRALRVGCCLWV